MSTLEQYRSGIAAYTAGRFQEAIDLLHPIVQPARGQDAHAATRQWSGKGMPARFYLAQAHYRLAVRLFEARRFPEATKHFQAAARYNPTGADYARFLAGCYIGTGQFELASQELGAMLRQQPDDAEIRIRLALTQCQQGCPTEAEATLREGIRRQPMHPELHYQLGVCLASQDNLGEAQKLFERTIALDPSHAGAYERLAQCCALVSRHERALAYLQQAHRLEPANARVALQLNLLAQSLLAAGFKVSVEWQPAVNSHYDQEAIERLGEAILREPEFVEAFLSLPETEVDCEVFSVVLAVLEQALRKHPEYADLHYHCGAVYRRLGHTREALRHAQRAVELNGNYVNALILLADLYGRTDQWLAGVERLEQAIRAGADYPDVHCLMGRLFQSGGQIDRARLAYRRALELNGEYSEAKEALAALAA